jgi:hypothetical protein
LHLVAKPGRNHEVAGGGALVDRDLDADGELALEDRDRLIAGDLMSVEAGNTTSVAVTPAGGKIQSFVGISDGSRGWFDWTW